MERVEAERAAQGEAAWRQWRRLWLRRNLCRTDFKRELLPRLGETVGGFLLEARLGAGGYGTVYLARRGGRLYALKLLYLPRVEEWAWRELEVMLRVRRMGVVKVAGYGEWPDRSPLFLFIAMEYVEGPQLYAWARRHQPTARRVAEVLRYLARQLVRVHGAGVVHRDVKGANVLVRQANGRPVLVDFGLGTYAGAPEVTGPLVPGTALYRSPEALRFRRERQQGERYVASARDDLWALGVVLYWLLTGAYPFDVRDSGDGLADEGALEDAILHQAPVPPHERNPRVPLALSRLCSRMLEKAPEARFADAQAVDAALEAALAGADAAWEVPLGHEPDNEDSLDDPPEPATPAPPTRSAPPTVAPPASAEPPPLEKRPARARALAWGVPGVTGAALLALAHLSSAPPASSRASSPEVSRAEPVRRWARALGVSGQEVALPWCPLEGATGAAPAWAATPASVARATLTKDMPVKASRQDSGPQRKPSQPQKPGSNALATALCTVAVGTSGCTGAQVRPAPEACPDGSLEAMKRLGIRVGDEIDVHLPYEIIEERAKSFVHPGKGTFEFSYELPGPGLKRRAGMLSGELILGSERVYGRFTQARLGDGPWFPVCFQLYTRANFVIKTGGGFVEGGPGVFRYAWKQRTDVAMITPTPSAQAVDHFD